MKLFSRFLFVLLFWKFSKLFPTAYAISYNFEYKKITLDE